MLAVEVVDKRVDLERKVEDRVTNVAAEVQSQEIERQTNHTKKAIGKGGRKNVQRGRKKVV